MRRFLAFMLLALFLFNTVGYYALYQAVRNQSNHALLKRLDQDSYREEETVTIKLPLAIPYYQSDTEYQRVNGSFEHQGEFFKLVKQKIEQDTLFIVCIRDHAAEKLFNLVSDFTKIVNDLPASSKSGVLKLLGSFSKDYEVVHTAHVNKTTAEVIKHHFCYQNFSLTDHYISIVSPPPEFLHHS